MTNSREQNKSSNLRDSPKGRRSVAFQAVMRHSVRNAQDFEGGKDDMSEQQTDSASVKLSNTRERSSWGGMGQVPLISSMLRRIRNALTGEVIAHLDAVNAENRLGREQVQRTLDEAFKLTQQRLSTVREELRTVREDLHHSHGKLDEMRHALRPVLELGEATAFPLADGYVFLPTAEKRLLLTYAGASSEGLEPGTRKVIQRLLLPGMRAVDVGANIGAMTLVMARAVGPTGHVDSFEPEPKLAEFFESMRSNNGLSWVTFHDVALGRDTKTARFNVSNVVGHSSLHDLPPDETGTSIDVKVRRLDELFNAELEIDLVKIDVEGAETEVLEGMSNLLARSPDLALIVEFGPEHLTRSGQSTREWLHLFEEHGLEGFSIGEPDGRCSYASVRDLETSASTNLVFVRRDGGMYRRMAAN